MAHIALIKDDGTAENLTEDVVALLGDLPMEWEDYLEDKSVAFIFRVAVGLGREGWAERLEEVTRQAQEAEERRERYAREAAERKLRAEQQLREQRANWERIEREQLAPLIDLFMGQARAGDVLRRAETPPNVVLGED